MHESEEGCSPYPSLSVSTQSSMVKAGEHEPARTSHLLSLSESEEQQVLEQEPELLTSVQLSAGV